MCTRDPTEIALSSPDTEELPTTPQTYSEATSDQADPFAWSCPQLPFLAMAIFWLSAVYVVSRGSVMGVFAFALGILLLGAPMCLAGICTGTLRRQRRLSAMFRRRGWLYALMARRSLSILAWTIWALAMSVLLLLQLHVYGPAEWLVLASTIPVFAVVFSTTRRRLVAEGMHEDMAVTAALRWSRWLCPAIVLVFYILAMLWWNNLPQHESFEAAIDAHKPTVAAANGSALVWEALHWIGYFEGMKAYALGNLGSKGAFGALFLLVLGTGALLYHVCLALSCLRIPRIGFVQACLVPRSSIDAFKVAAVATFLVVFIYFPLILYSDSFVSQSPGFAASRERAEAIAKAVAQGIEQIGNDYYAPGTGEQVGALREDTLRQFGKEVAVLRSEINSTFQRLENEAVDEYLDWYYSLAGEWVRLFVLGGGTGSLEDYLTKKGRETFEKEAWYEGLNTAFNDLLSTNDELRTAYERKVRNILNQNRLDSTDLQHVEIQVVLTASLTDILQLSLQQELIDGARRLLGAGVGGATVGKGVATIVAQKVTAKLAAKTAFKVAAKAPVKALLAKLAASTVSGAASGAALGSILPGPGTAAGVVAGTLFGLGVGVAIDVTLLELEEQFGRKDFRREIVTAIREARHEFEEEYLGSSHATSVASP